MGCSSSSANTVQVPPPATSSPLKANKNGTVKDTGNVKTAVVAPQHSPDNKTQEEVINQESKKKEVIPTQDEKKDEEKPVEVTTDTITSEDRQPGKPDTTSNVIQLQEISEDRTMEESATVVENSTSEQANEETGRAPNIQEPPQETMKENNGKTEDVQTTCEEPVKIEEPVIPPDEGIETEVEPEPLKESEDAGTNNTEGVGGASEPSEVQDAPAGDGVGAERAGTDDSGHVEEAEGEQGRAATPQVQAESEKASEQTEDVGKQIEADDEQPGEMSKPAAESSEIAAETSEPDAESSEPVAEPSEPVIEVSESKVDETPQASEETGEPVEPLVETGEGAAEAEQTQLVADQTAAESNGENQDSGEKTEQPVEE